MGQGTCTAPNTDEVCDNHLMCTGVFYPELRVPGDPFAHRGPAICRRNRIPADIHLTLTSQAIGQLQRRARGEVYGFINPEPPAFRVRTISESTAVASATNTLSVTLQTNFGLQALQETSVTLSGISSTTPSATRMPVVSAERHLELMVDCINSIRPDGQNVVSCHELGARALAQNDLIIDARLSLDLRCEWPSVPNGEYCSGAGTPWQSCVLVSGVRVGDQQIDGYSTSPCIQRFGCSEAGLCRVVELLPVPHLLDPTDATSGDGFLVELNVSHAVEMRAKVDIYFTSEYVTWNRTTGQIVVSGLTAPSFQKDYRTLSFSFQLLNTASARDAQVVTVIGESGAVKDIGICDDIIEEGCLRKGIPSTARAHMVGDILSARITPTFLSSARISQDSDVQGSRNIITVQLTPAMDASNFTAGSRVTISGLPKLGLASTSSLPIVSGRMALFAEWDVNLGQIVAHVNSQPSQTHASLTFSFSIRNPEIAQSPVSPAARVVGGMRDAHAWGQAALVCVTRTGCSGVLGGSTKLGFSMTQVWETDKIVGALNHVSFSVKANVPIFTKTTRLQVHGLQLPAQPSGVILLEGGGSLIRRASKCSGKSKCVMLTDTRPPSGAIGGKLLLSLHVDCSQIRSIFSVTACGTLLPASALLGSHCQESASSSSMEPAGFEIEACKSQESAKLVVTADGMLSVEAIFSIYYSFDTTTRIAKWSLLDEATAQGIMTIDLVPNSSHPDSASVTDPYSFAFRIAARNAARQVDAVTPSLGMEYDGFSLPTPQPVTTALGILGSGITKTPDISFWEVGQVIPSPDLTIYPSGSDCLVVVNVPQAGLITKITFNLVDLEFDTDRLYLIDGDSLMSSRVAGIFNLKSWGYVTNHMRIKDSLSLRSEIRALS